MSEREEIRNSIRAEKLRQRDALGATERRSSSKSIADSLLQLARSQDWHIVHCYLSFRSEVDTRAIVDELLHQGVRVIVPLVEPGDVLSHHELLVQGDHSLGRYGLPEPAKNEFTELELLDVVLLPLAAFDDSGNRLGYGKGFYDRFLAELRSQTQRIGLSFALQQADAIPAMPHDQKLDMIITERQIINTFAQS